MGLSLFLSVSFWPAETRRPPVEEAALSPFFSPSPLPRSSPETSGEDSLFFVETSARPNGISSSQRVAQSPSLSSSRSYLCTIVLRFPAGIERRSPFPLFSVNALEESSFPLPPVWMSARSLLFLCRRDVPSPFLLSRNRVGLFCSFRPARAFFPPPLVINCSPFFLSMILLGRLGRRDGPLSTKSATSVRLGIFFFLPLFLLQKRRPLSLPPSCSLDVYRKGAFSLFPAVYEEVQGRSSFFFPEEGQSGASPLFPPPPTLSCFSSFLRVRAHKRDAARPSFPRSRGGHRGRD